MVRDHLRKEHGRINMNSLLQMLLYHSGSLDYTIPKSTPEDRFGELPKINISPLGSSQLTAVAMSKSSSSQSADSTLGKSIESLDKGKNFEIWNGGQRPARLSSELNQEAPVRGDIQRERKTNRNDRSKEQHDTHASLKEALVQLENVELSQANQSHSASLIHIAIDRNANIRWSDCKDEKLPEDQVPGSRPRQIVGYIARDGVNLALPNRYAAIAYRF